MGFENDIFSLHLFIYIKKNTAKLAAVGHFTPFDSIYSKVVWRFGRFRAVKGGGGIHTIQIKKRGLSPRKNSGWQAESWRSLEDIHSRSRRNEVCMVVAFFSTPPPFFLIVLGFLIG